MRLPFFKKKPELKSNPRPTKKKKAMTGEAGNVKTRPKSIKTVNRQQKTRTNPDGSKTLYKITKRTVKYENPLNPSDFRRVPGILRDAINSPLIEEKELAKILRQKGIETPELFEGRRSKEILNPKGELTGANTVILNKRTGKPVIVIIHKVGVIRRKKENIEPDKIIPRSLEITFNNQGKITKTEYTEIWNREINSEKIEPAEIKKKIEKKPEPTKIVYRHNDPEAVIMVKKLLVTRNVDTAKKGFDKVLEIAGLWPRIIRVYGSAESLIQEGVPKEIAEWFFPKKN